MQQMPIHKNIQIYVSHAYISHKIWPCILGYIGPCGMVRHALSRPVTLRNELIAGTRDGRSALTRDMCLAMGPVIPHV